MNHYKVISKLKGKMETTYVYADCTEDIHAELEPDGHRIYVIEFLNVEKNTRPEEGEIKP